MIRLASRQGLLSYKELNKFQHFAASYSMGMERRVLVKDINDTLEKQLWYLDGERFDDLFRTPSYDAEGQVVLYGDGVPEEVETDLDEIDRYFESLDEKKSLNGAQLFKYLEPDEDGWV